MTGAEDLGTDSELLPLRDKMELEFGVCPQIPTSKCRLYCRSKTDLVFSLVAVAVVSSVNVLPSAEMV